MGARASLQSALVDALPATYEFIDDLRELGETDTETPRRLQLIRRLLEPAETQGAFWQEFDLWLITGLSDPADVETELDDQVDDVLEIIDLLDWLIWTAAERGVHPSGFHGYKITLRTRGNSTQ